MTADGAKGEAPPAYTPKFTAPVATRKGQAECFCHNNYQELKVAIEKLASEYVTVPEAEKNTTLALGCRPH